MSLLIYVFVAAVVFVGARIRKLPPQDAFLAVALWPLWAAALLARAILRDTPPKK